MFNKINNLSNKVKDVMSKVLLREMFYISLNSKNKAYLYDLVLMFLTVVIKLWSQKERQFIKETDDWRTE